MKPKQTMQFFEAATKFDQAEVQLRKTISGMLAEARETTQTVVREWPREHIDLTYGQAKVLQDNYCSLLMKDANHRWYKQIPGPELTVIISYISSGEVK